MMQINRAADDVGRYCSRLIEVGSFVRRAGLGDLTDPVLASRFVAHRETEVVLEN